MVNFDVAGGMAASTPAIPSLGGGVRFLERKQLLTDDRLAEWGADSFQLSQKNVSAALVQRAAILCVQARDGLRDQRGVVRHLHTAERHRWTGLGRDGR